MKKDLHLSESTKNKFNEKRAVPKLIFEKYIVLENIGFTYPNKDNYALNQVNISIPTNYVIGMAESSGSGKSTLFDIILVLLTP